MNKTLLLILCDFLLLNLLYAHSLKKGYIESDNSPTTEEFEANLTAGRESNLLGVMQIALEEEAAARQALSNQLASISTHLEKKEANLTDVESERSQMEMALLEAQQTKQQTAQQLAAAAKKAAELEKERTELTKNLKEQRSASEQRELELQIKRDAEARTHAEILAAREAALKESEAELAKRQAAMAELQKQNLEKQKELQTLQVKVEVAEVKQDMLRESLEARVRAELELKEEEARKKQEALAKLEAQRTDAEKLARELEMAVAKAELEKKLLRESLTEKLEQQTEAQKREVAKSEKALAELEKQKSAALNLVTSLDTAVKNASVENKSLRENVSEMKKEVAIVRQEKAELQQQTTKLTEGVTMLAQKSETVAQGVNQISGKTEAIAQDVGQLRAQGAQVQQGVTQIARQSDAIVKNVNTLNTASKAIAVNMTNLTFKSERISADVGKLQENSAEITQGVVQLAMKSDTLAEEIRENRPINLNILFNEFRTNRIDTTFTGVYKGFLGPVEKSSSVSSVVVKAGRNYYSLVHIKNTPFELSSRGRGTDWLKITGIMSRPGGTVRFNGLEFLYADPRVLMIPLTEAEAERLGSEPYLAADNPFQFTDAVLIGKDGEYYGETPFRVDPKAPQYVKMKTSFRTRLFGDFSPSTGDLVFSKTGELLGIMVNREYAVVLNNFKTARPIDFNDNLANVKTGTKFEEMHFLYTQLPAEVR